ncbi:MAG: hypothetical protein AAF902_04000 [Chloroflexota bacterium]
MPLFDIETQKVTISDRITLNTSLASGSYTILGSDTTSDGAAFEVLEVEELDQFAELCRENGVTIESHFSVTVDGAAPETAALETTAIEPMTLDVENPDPQKGMAVYHVDEAGTVRWIFPNGLHQEAGSLNTTAEALGTTLSFNLPLAAMTGGQSESLALRVGQQFVRLVSWPLEQAAFEAIRLWEKAFRPYEFLQLKDGEFKDDIDWRFLRSGRSLLLIHGTFVYTESTYDALIAALIKQGRFDELWEHYDGRIFAFSHPSLHHSPFANIDKFFEMLPFNGRPMELDFIAHSRGGLVARVLAEQPAHPGRVKVNKGVFVGTPNRGTALADKQQWPFMLNRMANVALSLPINQQNGLQTALIRFAQFLGQGIIPDLPGLQSMDPDGAFQQNINQTSGHNTEYFAITADSEPTGERLLNLFRSEAADPHFDHAIHGEDNDVVVPSAGVHTLSQSATGFPIPTEKVHLFADSTDVHHSNFFSQSETINKLIQWLT